MLVLQIDKLTHDNDEWIDLFDAGGNRIASVSLVRVMDWGGVRLGFEAPGIKIYRRKALKKQGPFVPAERK